MKNLYTPPKSKLVSTLEPSAGRRVRIFLYVVLCIAAAHIPLVLELANYPASDAESAAVLLGRALGGLLVLAIFTFPAGFVPALCWWLIVVWPQTSIATPAGGVLLLSPLFIAVGYLQWFVWVPRFVLRNSSAFSPDSPTRREHEPAP